MIPLFKVFMPNEVSIGIVDVLNSGQLAYGTHPKNFETKLFHRCVLIYTAKTIKHSFF